MARRLPLVLTSHVCVFLALSAAAHAATTPPPIPTAASATAVKQDAALHYLVQLKGTNFQPNTMITVNGTGLTTTYVSSTLMTGILSLSPGAATLNIGAYTPYAAQPKISNTVPVPVTDAYKLQITGVSNPARLLTTVTFKATFSGATPANPALNWNVNGIAGGNATVGTITSGGVYTPPAVIPAGASVTIGVSSAAASNVTATVATPILNPYPQVTARSATKVGNTLNYLVDLKGTGFIPGSVIASNGVAQTTKYLSPTEIQATVNFPAGTTAFTATVSQPNPGAVTSTNYSIAIAQAVTVTVSGPASPRLATTSTYTAAVSGTTNTQVQWQVNGVVGGSAQTGTITQSGVYTAPSIQPSGAVSITAVSTAATQCSGTFAIALQNPLPTVSSGSATQVAGATSFPIDVRGTGFTPNSTILANGSTISTTYVSPTELQGRVSVAANATSIPVAVTNPAPGAATSNTYNLNFTKVAVTAAAAARLLDQSSFGPTIATIQHVQQIGLQPYLNEQYALPATQMAPIGNPLPLICRASNVPQDCAIAFLWQTVVLPQDQLRQRVAFALSEMFSVSLSTAYAQRIPSYYNALENNAFGNFATLLKAVTLSQAMGTSLNMMNSAAAPTGQQANENLAREMMQLFTIGPYMLNADGTRQLNSAGQPIPAYTQAQVQAFARAYTGWTMANADGSRPYQLPNSNANYDAAMAAYEAAHDQSAKQLLNGTTLPAGQTAEQDLDGALANLFAHPNVGPFVCRQLIQHLVTSAPSPAYVARVSAVFANNGSGVRGDLKAVVNAIMMDAEARAGDTNPTFNGGHLREPILLMANLARAFNFTFPSGYFAGFDSQSKQFGESAFGAPSIFGYFRPEYVIGGTQLNAPEFGLENTANDILRMNVLNTVVTNSMANITYDQSAYVSLAAYPPDLVDTLGAVLMHAQMPDDMRTVLINTVTPIADNAARTRTAMYLVINSPQYLIQH